MAATRPTACASPRLSGPRRSSGVAAFAGGSRLSGAPGFAGAAGLARGPESSLVSESCVRHLALFPRHLGRLRSGIGEQLDAELLRYSESLKGVPLAYDNMKLLSGLGDLIDDQGYIHMDVQADFVVFRPNPGDILKGVVNKLGSAHVGCLVHGCFNASLACPRDEPGVPWRGAGLFPGDTVRFTVTHVDSDWAGVLLVRGSLIGLGVPDESDAEQANGAAKQEHEGVQKVPVEYTDSAPNEKKKKKKEKKKCDREVGVTIKVEETMEVEEVVEHRHERKKKKSKRKGEGDGEEPICDGVTKLPVKEEPESELCTEIGSEACTSQTEASVSPDQKKKKKKRRRDRDEEGSTVPLSDGSRYLSNDAGHEANGTLTSDSEAPKKEKKRKRNSVEDISLSESPLPKSKRRK